MRRALATLCLALFALLSGSAGAQRVTGPGPTAVTLPRGGFRVTVEGDHQLFRERWNDGVREPLGSGFSVPSLDGRHLSALQALAINVSTLATIPPTFNPLTPTLGSTRLDLRQRVFTTRFGFEYGIADWLTVGVEVPMVRTRSEAQLRAGGTGFAPTAGANPVFQGTGVAAANRAKIDAYAAAAAALESRRDDCTANAGSHPECGDILLQPTQVQNLIDEAAQFAAVLAATYGAQGLASGLPFVPMAGSDWEALLLATLDQMRTGFVGYGVSDITATTGLPLGAQTPLSETQLAAMVDTIYGARPMTRTARQTLGDVDLGVRVRLFEKAVRGAQIRQTVGFTYRFGNGELDSPDNFIDVGTGVSANGIALRSFTDLVFGDRLWATVAVGFVQGGAYDRSIRVPSAYGIDWLEPWRTTAVDVTPGRLLEFTVAPRWMLNDYFAVGAEWQFRLKSPDETTPAETLEADPHGTMVLRNARFLDAASEWAEQRLAWTVAYSTVTAASRGKSRVAFEIGYTHEESVESSGGIIPRRFTDRVQLRYFPRFFTR